ncbi:MAG: metallophosphoesterase [Gemmataceae bacterium]|nr:metallophosphoesterase [Gemmataceae bacterium]
MPQAVFGVTRRQFLRVVGAGAGWLAVRPAFARGVDPHRVALLSDTHIPDTPGTQDHGCSMVERLRTAVKEITGLADKPTAAIFDGDLAWKVGTRLEYATLAKEIEPLVRAGVPLHFGLGNHDTRDAFLAGFQAHAPEMRPVDGKHILIVDTPRADLFILDSLEPSLGAAGKCGKAQTDWLALALDLNEKKPAVLFVHHNPVFAADPKSNGLADTTELWKTIQDRKRVKALVFGHTHTWKVDRKDGIHLINLPAVGYPFKASEVTGWVDAFLGESGMKLAVQAFDRKHPAHGKVTELTWR